MRLAEQRDRLNPIFSLSNHSHIRIFIDDGTMSFASKFEIDLNLSWMPTQYL
ncbi:hypothetical protein [Trichocoleus sp. FACHB-262]|uniref:hypothetical protein n=1 Tax=Trichocoleus sp. FACHB-262 TaxID=2692869 RepID=UPI0019C91276|nr:hypothetical protein [Trichocoleus sp. FACHB-262]MBD2120899.1 hypothetical protein [Trichocoleus sp. FACHB-262]